MDKRYFESLSKGKRNKAINTLRGWRAEKHERPSTNPNYCAKNNCTCWAHAPLWYAYTPDGELISDVGYTTEDSVRKQYHPDWYEDGNWPKLLREMAAETTFLNLSWSTFGNQPEVWFVGHRMKEGEGADCHSGTESGDIGEAVCIAWLKWKEATRDVRGTAESG